MKTVPSKCTISFCWSSVCYKLQWAAVLGNSFYFWAVFKPVGWVPQVRRYWETRCTDTLLVLVFSWDLLTIRKMCNISLNLQNQVISTCDPSSQSRHVLLDVKPISDQFFCLPQFGKYNVNQNYYHPAIQSHSQHNNTSKQLLLVILHILSFSAVYPWSADSFPDISSSCSEKGAVPWGENCPFSFLAVFSEIFTSTGCISEKVSCVHSLSSYGQSEHGAAVAAVWLCKCRPQ